LFAAVLAFGPKPPVGLSDFVGRDLTKLSKSDSALLTKRFRAITKETGRSDPWFEPEPRWIKHYRTGAIEWLFLKVYPGYNVPDMSFVRAYAYDANWKFIKRYEVPTGYRLRFTKEQLVENSWISPPILRITVSSVGPFVVKEGQKPKPLFHPEAGIVQTYAFSEGGATLIRIEDGEGAMLANSYQWDVPAIGPDVSRRTVAAWRQELLAADPVRRLGFLVWISGTHLNSKQVREKNVSREPVAESLAYETLRADKTVRAAIEKLAQSANPWLKEQAAFALKRLQLPLEPPEDRGIPIGTP
jgi:hypothetical protein